MIRIAEVSKSYGATLALDALTLELPDGAILGLLGPNASGKSTLIKLTMGYIFPDHGKIDLGALSTRQIGYVPERPNLPPRCPIDEYLMTAGQLSGSSGATLRENVNTRLHQVGLAGAGRLRVNVCSKGMLQRLALAAALVNDPPLLLLDEPMSGLDPFWQKACRDLIVALHHEGKTILLSTHRLSEIAEICTHVAILNQGKLKRAGSLAEVLPLRPQVVISVDHLPGDLARSIAARSPEITVRDDTVVLNGDAVACKQVVLYDLLQAGVDIRHLEQQRATLEQVYLEAMRS